MARRPQLTAEPRSALFDPPRLPRELVRHSTLSDEDLDLVRRCRGDHNRLGDAVQLAYARGPGRRLRPEERPPAELVEAVADQLGVPPGSLDSSLSQDQTRRRHAADLQDRRKLRPFTARHGRTVTAALMPTALVTERQAKRGGVAAPGADGGQADDDGRDNGTPRACPGGRAARGSGTTGP